jgi:hypothetical protein
MTDPTFRTVTENLDWVSLRGFEVSSRVLMGQGSLLLASAPHQNLTEIPPRTDRRLLPTTVRSSPFSELV